MSNLTYPRLADDAARILAQQLMQADMTVAMATGMARAEHPRAAPVATGGTPVLAADLQRRRDAVLSDVAEVFQGSGTAALDLTMGRALHTHLQISPADAGNHSVWNFISLVLLPDLVLRRFPHPTMERLMGAGPRSALRRVWLRQEIFGAAMSEVGAALSEDEWVGITERSSLLRNRDLSVTIAREMSARPGRSEDWSREFLKAVRWRTGPLLLDIFDRAMLQEFVREIADRVTTEPGPAGHVNGAPRETP